MCRNFEKFSRKPYRGFEFLSLRHAVWTAEKFPNIASKNARNGRNSAIFTPKPDQRKRPVRQSGATLEAFSLHTRNSVRFRRGAGANAMRSQSDHVAKPAGFLGTPPDFCVSGKSFSGSLPASRPLGGKQI